MLTCKVGEKIINTFDYSSEEIRKWSNKSILKCPVCDSEVIYRHGEFKIPHFAHKSGSECEEIFGEEDNTEEHLNAIKDIYLRLKEIEKEDNKLSDIELEYWIKITKQRSDISFIYDGKRYAIEVQCSPLSTKFMERRRLYELSGIKDIWILGNEKYKENNTSDGFCKTKEIERQILYSDSQVLMYYNYENRIMKYVDFDCADALLDRKTTFDFKFNELNINDLKLELLFKQSNSAIQQNIKIFMENCIGKENVRFNYYLKELDKKVFCYFEDNLKNKFAVEYVNSYLHKDSYEDLKYQYKNLNINPIIFLNLKYYDHTIRVGVSTDEFYGFANSGCKRLFELLPNNAVFVDENGVIMIENKYKVKSSLKKSLNGLISNFNIYVKKSELEMLRTKLKNKDIDFEEKLLFISEKINDKIKRELIDSILEIEHIGKFKRYHFQDLIFCDKRVSDSSILLFKDKKDKLANEIHNSNYVNLISERITDFLQKKIAIENERVERLNNNISEYNKIKDKLKNIFDKNKKNIVEYDLNYSTVINNQIFKNLIYFKDATGKEFIFYTSDDSLIHTDIDKKWYFEIPSNEKYTCTNLNLHFSNEDFYLYKSYSEEYVLGLASEYNLFNFYNFYKIVDEYIDLIANKNINLFYKHKSNKKPKENIRYVYLKDYDFISVIETINKLYQSLELVKEKCFLDIGCESEKILDMTNPFILNNPNSEVAQEVYEALKPIIDICKKIKNKDINIMLNPIFTKNQKGYRPWLINDFIGALENIGLYNIENLKEEVFND